MFDFNKYDILCFSRSVDMRKSFSGLLGIVKSELTKDPVSETLFLFYNERRNYLKVLFWDRTGYCLLCKKLERGSFNFGDHKNLDLQKLRLVFDGIRIGKKC